MKYKMIYMIFAFLLFFIAGFDVAFGQNIVKNGGFEVLDDKYFPVDWGCDGAKWFERPAGAGCSKVSCDGVVKHSGNRALCLHGNNNRGIATQTVAISSGGVYKVSGWIKTEGLENTSASLGISFYQSPWKYLGGDNAGRVNGTADWTFVEKQVKAPAGCDYFFLTLTTEGANNGLAWFDDISIEVYDGKQKEASVGENLKAPKSPSPVEGIRKELVVRRNDKSLPCIDGRLDDECWRDLKWEEFLVNADGAMPEERTEFKIIYDDNYIYLCFRCYESRIEKIKTRYKEHDSFNLFQDDCLELFLAPDDRVYYYFCVNSLGVLADKYLKDVTWESRSQVAVKVYAASWDVEMAVPFAGFAITPGVSNVWRGNFCREEQRIPEYTAWSPTAGTFARPERFGKLKGLALEETTFRNILSEETVLKLDDLKKGLADLGTNVSAEAVAKKHEELKGRLTLLFSNLAETGKKRADDKAWNVLWEQVADLEASFKTFQSLCRAYEFYGRKLGKGATLDYGVGIAPATEKIFRDEPFEGEFTNVARISAARGEFESFQIALVPLGKDMEDIKIEWTDLTGSGGKIDKYDITVSKVGYVETKPPFYDVERHVKFWPDPLMPLYGFDTPVSNVERGMVQPVWVMVKVPDDIPAGNYDGKIVVKPDNSSATEIKINLHVWNFNIPERSHLTIIQWVNLHAFRSFYFKGQYVPMGFVDPFLKFMMEHKITPLLFPDWSGNEFRTANIFLEKNGSYSFDFAPLKKFLIAYCREKKIDVIMPLLQGHMVGILNGKADSEVYDKRADKKTVIKTKDVIFPYLRALDDFLKNEGWFDKVEAIYLVWDEPMPCDYEKLKEIQKKFKSLAPHLKILQTSYHRFPVPELEDYVDIWVPEVRCFDKEAADSLVKRGKTVWWYSANADYHPFPALYTDYPAIDCRIIPWMNWKLGISGWMHCTANHWSYGPFNYAEPRWPKKMWSALWFEEGKRVSNETGWIYPGPDGPISSIRLESFRDGLEDYEYFYLLNEKLKELKKKGGKYQGLIREIEVVLKIDDEIVKSNSSYTKDTGKLLSYKEKVARYVEKADRVLNPEGGWERALQFFREKLNK